MGGGGEGGYRTHGYDRDKMPLFRPPAVKVRGLAVLFFANCEEVTRRMTHACAHDLTMRGRGDKDMESSGPRHTATDNWASNQQPLTNSSKRGGARFAFFGDRNNESEPPKTCLMRHSAGHTEHRNPYQNTQPYNHTY